MLQCWCYQDNVPTAILHEVCGYPSDYNGEFHSIASTGKPWDLIESFGKKPDPEDCQYNTKDGCQCSCGGNVCDPLGYCCGRDIQFDCSNYGNPWEGGGGIVRCTNMETPY